MDRNVFSTPRILVVSMVAAALLSVAMLDAVLAQSTNLPLPAPQQQPTRTPSAGLATPGAVAPIGLLSPTVAASDTAAVTATAGVPPAVGAPDPDIETIRATGAAVSPQPVEDEIEAEPLTGTILSNRTNYAAKFFLEGRTYRVEPFSSIGLDLMQDEAFPLLYSCDAETPESQGGCTWTPHVLQRDDYYEIIDSSSVVGLPTLLIEGADAPPEDEVWIHNRTGITEAVIFQDIVNNVAPGAVHELDVEVGAPVIVYVRSCANLEGEQVCEWAPITLETGAYFAMIEVSTPGAIPGSRITTIDLRPVLDTGGEVLAAAASVACELNVPALNIRSGPGLQYPIVGKVRSTEEEVGRVSIVGRSADGLWFAVSESLAQSGWVTSNPDFMACLPGANDLPIAEFTGEPPAPTATPAPVVVVTQDSQQQNSSADQDTGQTEPVISDTESLPVEESTDVEAPEIDTTDVVTASEDSPAAGIPEGLALLVVNNGFQYPIRFTVDQQYRPAEGPSEYDLEPGASTNVIVFPGTIAFTASSPWNGLSGNSDLEVGADQSIVLWLRFEPEPDDSSQWRLAWE